MNIQTISKQLHAHSLTYITCAVFVLYLINTNPLKRNIGIGCWFYLIVIILCFGIRKYPSLSVSLIVFIALLFAVAYINNIQLLLF